MSIPNVRSGTAPLADEEAALERGKGSMLIAVVALVALLGAGLWFFVSGGDEARVYGELGRKINGLRQTQFDQFWSCALPGVIVKDLNANTDVMTQIDGRAAEGGGVYATRVNDECLDKLAAIEPALDDLIIPEDLQPGVVQLKQSSIELRKAWSALIAYLQKPAEAYSTDGARPFLEQVARGWFDFRTAHAAINRTLKAKLDQK